MKSARILREKIATGKLTLGLLAIDHFWVGLVEICRNAGMDYLIIDQEHGVFDEERVVEACAIGRMLDFPILIRPDRADYDLMRRMADKGPCGFLLPMVESAAMLDGVRDALYMPPRGRRRPGGPGNRWVTDYQYETWRDEVENDFIVLPQVENQEGLENADAIARHEITTAVAVGPYDLSASLGVCWKPDDPKLVQAIARVRKAGRDAGKNMWMIGNPAVLMQQGFTFICMGDPVGILETTLTQSIRQLRANGAAASHPPATPV